MHFDSQFPQSVSLLIDFCLLALRKAAKKQGDEEVEDEDDGNGEEQEEDA